jgi:Zn-dependent protease with chaperone function
METPAGDTPAAPPPRPPMSTEPIRVQPHGAEMPLKVILTVIGIIFWVVIIVSLVGDFYAVLLGLAYLIAHMGLIVHLRGSSVKLGPKQMPGLYKRVVVLAKRMGLRKIPDAYLVQSGGVLNAFATKFGSRTFIALYSDMVRSCGDNMDALDFIIGHELGHLHRGHLRWRFLKAPAMIIPFLGTAYYRSCEYTCDQYGKESCGDHSKCLDGLCLLAGGSRYAANINRGEFIGQIKDLNTILMKLGSWFATHPPLARRAAALAPELAPRQDESLSTAGAFLIAVLLAAVPIGFTAWAIPDMFHTIQSIAKMSAALSGAHAVPAGQQFKPMPQMQLSPQQMNQLQLNQLQHNPTIPAPPRDPLRSDQR